MNIENELSAISAVLMNTEGAMRLLLISNVKVVWEREARYDFSDECLCQLGEVGLIRIDFCQVRGIAHNHNQVLITPRGVIIAKMLEKAMNLGLVNLGLARE